jgi:hypothetical protein
MGGLTALRTQRGHLITLRELRYMDLPRVARARGRGGHEPSTTRCRRPPSSSCCAPTRCSRSPPARRCSRAGRSRRPTSCKPVVEEVAKVGDGLGVLGGVGQPAGRRPHRAHADPRGHLEVFAHLNRVRATVDNRRKQLLSAEGKAEFAAQFNLFGQAVTSSIGMADTPERCDEQLSRLMVQLEELEAKFSEFDEFLGQISSKREEIYEALGNKKQQLLDERQRRVQNLWQAAERILARGARAAPARSRRRRAQRLLRVRRDGPQAPRPGERILALGDSVKADEVQSQLKSARQDALRALRDRLDLFERRRRSSSSGATASRSTPSRSSSADPAARRRMALTCRAPTSSSHRGRGVQRPPAYWAQQLPSETPEVYRGEYLAACIVLRRRGGPRGPVDRRPARRGAGRGRGCWRWCASTPPIATTTATSAACTTDGGAILGKLMGALRVAGLLRFGPSRARWRASSGRCAPTSASAGWHRRAQSLARLRAAFRFGRRPGRALVASELRAIGIDASSSWLHELGLRGRLMAHSAARYLVEELARPRPRFTTSAEAQRLRDALMDHLDVTSAARLRGRPARARRRGARAGRAVRVWLEALLVATPRIRAARARPAMIEAAVLLATGTASSTARATRRSPRRWWRGCWASTRGSTTRCCRCAARVHRAARRVRARATCPGSASLPHARQALLERERKRLRLDEFMPRVLTSFVRNKLINEVYLRSSATTWPSRWARRARASAPT